jgi:hypothetical protein
MLRALNVTLASSDSHAMRSALPVSAISPLCRLLYAQFLIHFPL